jgi:hypothetical protein
VLGLLGNGFDTSTQWVARVREILGPPALERRGHWPSGETLESRFTDTEEREFPHEQQVNRASLRDLAVSRSSLAILSASERESVLRSLDRLWEAEPELAGRDQAMLSWRARVRRCKGRR